MTGGHINFGEINSAALAACPDLLKQWFPLGQKSAHEFAVGNLAGDQGDSLKVNLHSGKWADFATGDSGGDLISLYAAIHRLRQSDAARQLAQELGCPELVGARRNRKQGRRAVRSVSAGKAVEDWTPIMPPAIPPPDVIGHPKLGQPHETWTYRDETGDPIFVVCRWNGAPGKGNTRRPSKKILPFAYGVYRGNEGWHFKHPGKPRPLYGLDRLAANPDADVLLTEGEKAVDTAQRLLPHVVAMTWPGGANAASHADFSVLAGRNVLIWPDNDKAGRKAATAVADILGRLEVPRVTIIEPPSRATTGWDLADAESEGWDTDRVLSHVRKASRTVELRPAETPVKGSDVNDAVKRHFRSVGYEHDRFYFLTSRGRQVLEFSARSLKDRATLMALAPLKFWEQAFPAGKSIHVNGAVDWLIDRAYRAGVYDTRRLRGRGAWWDDGRVVLHLGDRLLVDGRSSGVTEIESRYIYEAAAPFNYTSAEPLSDSDAEAFLEIVDMLAWERSVSGLLLAGWCLVAPICGALTWRPHIWITSKAGAGKSLVMDHIIRAAVGDLALAVQSKSTEAGLRQEIGGDARPVLFDEAEGEDQRSRDRMQAVIEIARASSSEDGADIIKGTASGHVKHYRLRSCFAFSSINVLVRHFADESRVTVLSLLGTDNENEDVRKAQDEHFKQLQGRVHEVMTPDFSSRLLARSLRLMPVIRKNAATFSRAAAEQLHSRRLGDQVGTLLAGVQALRSTAAVTPEETRTIVTQLDWSAHVPSTDKADEVRLLSTLLEHLTRVQTGGTTTAEMTISELVFAAAGRSDTEISEKEAEKYLRRRGLRLDETKQHLLVSNQHSEIARILEKTPWASGWSRVLKRLPGAQSTSDPVRFGPEVKQRAVQIPLARIFDD